MYEIIKYIRYIIPLAVGLKLGACVAFLDNDVRYMKESHLEKITDDKVVVTQPKTHKKYIIDFDNNVIIPYSKDKIENITKKELFDYLIDK